MSTKLSNVDANNEEITIHVRLLNIVMAYAIYNDTKSIKVSK